MTATRARTLPTHVDVLVIGAGLAGVGAACRLTMQRPGTSFAVIEARDRAGGTWDLFRFPGVRSDSDMASLGYEFRPWQGERVMADGAAIQRYVEETAAAFGVDRHVHYGRRVTRLSWDGDLALWTATIESADDSTAVVTAAFVHACTGYYRYDEGHQPDFPDMELFAGELLHPQHWPADFDPTGKRVIVIGSGATAVTIVPALAREADHVTMLQRSPSHITSLPGQDVTATLLRRVLPDRIAHRITRWKNIAVAAGMYSASRRFPGAIASLLRWRIARQLPDEIDVERHFTPSYDPWDQRLCLVPDNDVFRALASDRASIVTDTTEGFVPEGVVLGSGEVLEADAVVTATGLQLLMLGGIELVVDGEVVDPVDTVAYRGLMLCGVPNLAFTVGYVNASWTLRAELVATHVCDLLDHMDRHGHDVAVPTCPPADTATRPLIDLEAGYVRRGLGAMPRQGVEDPWRIHQSYRVERRLLREVAGPGIVFRRRDDVSAAARRSLSDGR